MCAVVCSYCMSNQHLDAKIVNISHRDVGWFPIGMYGWEPTFESLGKPILKQVSSGWHLKQIEEWLLLSSMCAVVCLYCMSHQHLDAKIVKNVPYKCMGGSQLLNRLVNPYQSRYARGGI